MEVGTQLAALIRGLPLRQVDRVCPSRPAAGSAAIAPAAAADERPPGEAEVALLDAVPAVLEAVLAALDLVIDLGDNSKEKLWLELKPLKSVWLEVHMFKTGYF